MVPSEVKVDPLHRHYVSPMCYLRVANTTGHAYLAAGTGVNQEHPRLSRTVHLVDIPTVVYDVVILESVFHARMEPWFRD